MTRCLVRGLLAFTAILTLSLGLGYALHLVAAAAVLTLAVIFARASYRLIPPIHVPPSRALPDPGHGTEGASGAALITGRAAHLPSVIHPG